MQSLTRLSTSKPVALFAVATAALFSFLRIVRHRQKFGFLDISRVKTELLKRPDDFRKKLVAHRGFHYPSDDLKRPLENTLSAYERAWSAGVVSCECDVTLTKDSELILCHDNDLSRLALISTKTPISNMYFKNQLEFFPLKDGCRVPKLTEILEAAKRIGKEKRLVIEIKGEDLACARKIYQDIVVGPRSDLNEYIGVVMGFSFPTVSEFAKLNKERKCNALSMLLTVRTKGRSEYQYFDLDETDRISGLISSAGIDGLYLQYDPAFLTDERFAQLCLKLPIGVWGRYLADPDHESVCATLFAKGARFVNTDFPDNFFH